MSGTYIFVDLIIFSNNNTFYISQDGAMETLSTSTTNSNIAPGKTLTPFPKSAPSSPNPSSGGTTTLLLPPARIDRSIYSTPSHIPLEYGLDPITNANGLFPSPKVSTKTSPPSKTLPFRLMTTRSPDLGIAPPPTRMS
ncbi:hypothetical protein MA16_Dca027091 [Dendrobium catenatum]|uniref:Uncharacterized protein n=1 Tax=Dendrobium catenatum TaxID=906689 RepID=A0A2I0V991_9ASPA|nr:hypothetical protein MA16_Dca027091 [Dendrobium catenatum]